MSSRKSKLILLFLLVGATVALPSFAQGEGAAVAGSGPGWGLGIAMLGLGIAAAGGALAQGRASADALAGMARNPGASGRIQTALLISLAFMESLVIFTWVMVYLVRLGN